MKRKRFLVLRKSRLKEERTKLNKQVDIMNTDGPFVVQKLSNWTKLNCLPIIRKVTWRRLISKDQDQGLDSL